MSWSISRRLPADSDERAGAPTRRQRNYVVSLAASDNTGILQQTCTSARVLNTLDDPETDPFILILG